MKFFKTSQIRQLDQYTIAHEPISSSDLMERAAFALFKQYALTFHCNEPILVMAGPGNNGGDALALAKRLLTAGLDVKILLLHTGKLSADCKEKLTSLKAIHAKHIIGLIKCLLLRRFCPTPYLSTDFSGQGSLVRCREFLPMQ